MLYSLIFERLKLHDPLFEQEHHRRVFRTMDMLRGIAAIAVVGRHLNHSLFALLPSSYLAVDLFFVLSGFVIEHAYGVRLRQNLGKLDFIKIRIIRLYPMYILSVFGSVLFLIGTISVKYGVLFITKNLLVSLFFSLFFLPDPPGWSYDPAAVYPLNFPAWSLLDEIGINIIYVWILKRLRTNVLIVLILTGAALLVHVVWTRGGLAGGADWATFSSGPQRVVYSFFAGVAMYRIWASGIARSFTLPPWAAGLTLIVVFAIRPDNRMLYDLGVSLLIFPALTLAATREPGSRLTPACTLLGLLSYPLYALHAPFLQIEAPLYRRLAANADGLGLPLELAFVLSMIVVALIAERYLDAPVRNWLLRMNTKRDGERPSTRSG